MFLRRNAGENMLFSISFRTLSSGAEAPAVLGTSPVPRAAAARSSQLLAYALQTGDRVAESTRTKQPS